MKTRACARLLAASAAAGLITLGLAVPASAHVTVTPETTAANSYTIVTMSVPHGCDGAPTTRVAVQIPEDILAVTPTRNAYYDVVTKMEQLAEPVTDLHGNSVTERVASVVYTARTPLPEGQRDSFELSMQLPDEPGETLAFPSIQTCQKGETAWIEVPTGDQDADDLEHPAPAFEITEAGDDDSAATSTDDVEQRTGDAEAAGSTPQSSSVEAEDDSGAGTTLGVVGLVLGALGLATGGTALARVRRRA